MSAHEGRKLRAELLLKGITLSDIARRCNVGPSAVSRVVARRATSRKIENEIARVLGRERREVFPRLQWVQVPDTQQHSSKRLRPSKHAA